jgi:YHS domain-containing protein
MAHRSNVIQVSEKFETAQDSDEKSIDPVCKMEVLKSTARHILYRQSKVHYFCSKECQSKFIHSSFSLPGQVA